jgi:hypothetical protein
MRAIDVNDDGMVDGLRGMLVEDPADAVSLPLDEWTAGVLRCSKSSGPCASDADCPRGACTSGVFCNVFQQNCLDGLPCVLDEACLPGKVFLTGPDIVPDSQYDVRAESGATSSPAGSATTCLWGDVTCNEHINVQDVLMVVLGIYGEFQYATLAQLDIHPCHPQRVLNVSDVQAVILEIYGQTYEETGCPLPCP